MSFHVKCIYVWGWRSESWKKLWTWKWSKLCQIFKTFCGWMANRATLQWHSTVSSLSKWQISIIHWYQPHKRLVNSISINIIVVILLSLYRASLPMPWSVTGVQEVLRQVFGSSLTNRMKSRSHAVEMRVGWALGSMSSCLFLLSVSREQRASSSDCRSVSASSPPRLRGVWRMCDGS